MPMMISPQAHSSIFAESNLLCILSISGTSPHCVTIGMTVKSAMSSIQPLNSTKRNQKNLAQK